MSAYRAREIVDAVQWFKHGDSPHVKRDNCLQKSEWELAHPDEYGVVWNDSYGSQIVVGEWIVRSASGRLHVWSDDAFRNHFQPTRAKAAS